MPHSVLLPYAVNRREATTSAGQMLGATSATKRPLEGQGSHQAQTSGTRSGSIDGGRSGAQEHRQHAMPWDIECCSVRGRPAQTIKAVPVTKKQSSAQTAAWAAA